MSSVTFNQINVAFDTINYPFNNILLGLFVKGTETVKVRVAAAPVLTRIRTAIPPVYTKVSTPVAPTYTRVS